MSRIVSNAEAPESSRYADGTPFRRALPPKPVEVAKPVVVDLGTDKIVEAIMQLKESMPAPAVAKACMYEFKVTARDSAGRVVKFEVKEK